MSAPHTWTQREKLEDIYRWCAELAVRQNRLKDHLWLGLTLTMVVLSLVLLLVAADPGHDFWPYQVCHNETTYETGGLFWRDDIGACPDGEPFMTRDREWVCRIPRVTPVCHIVYPKTVWEDGIVTPVSSGLAQKQ